MTTESMGLYADFPKAVRGYATNAVDDFVRQIGERLENLQEALDEKTERVNRLEKELKAANQTLVAFAEKEAAIASALVATEQRRAGVERELESRRAEAAAQAAQIVEEARREAENILDDARKQAAEIISHAESARAAQEERLQKLYADYQETADRIREALEAHISLLPPPGATRVGLTTPNGIALTTTMELARDAA